MQIRAFEMIAIITPELRHSRTLYHDRMSPSSHSSSNSTQPASGAGIGFSERSIFRNLARDSRLDLRMHLVDPTSK